MNRSDASGDDVRVVTAALLSVLPGSDRVESFLVEVARSPARVVGGGGLTCGVTVRTTPGSRMPAATSDRRAASASARGAPAPGRITPCT